MGGRASRLGSCFSDAGEAPLGAMKSGGRTPGNAVRRRSSEGTYGRLERMEVGCLALRGIHILLFPSTRNFQNWEGLSETRAEHPPGSSDSSVHSTTVL